MHLTAAEIVRATRGLLVRGSGRRVCRRISTDSRTIEPGEWFLALEGETFDGHDFVETALERGAGGLIVRYLLPEVPGIPVIAVEDTLEAFGQVAALWRRRMKTKVIAVTGSSGKTTTKDMLGAIMARHAATLVTEGNLNNRIGVPHQIQRLARHHRWAVLEIGMNMPGEIGVLSWMVRPRIGLITNVGEAHSGMFEDGARGVFNAKAEMLDHIESRGTVVLNADDADNTARLARRARRRGLRVAKFSALHTSRADLWVERSERLRPFGRRVILAAKGESVQVDLSVFGHYNVSNLAAAAAAARCAGAPLELIPGALEGFTPKGLRSRVREIGGATVLVDCYNANPQSVAEALAALGGTGTAGRRIAVLGDMRELGGQSRSIHRQMGRVVKSSGVDRLVTFGDEARSIAVGARVPGRHFADPEACARHLRRTVRSGDIVLVKGSRVLAMERIVEAWEAAQ